MLDTARIRVGLITVILVSLLLYPVASLAREIVVATVNNRDMLNMKTLSEHFLEQNPDISIRWKVVDESVLRLMQSRDSKRSEPRYDVYTVGLLEAPLWGRNGRLAPVPKSVLSGVAGSDWIPEVMQSFRYGEHYYALPFYGESSITYYRKDVFKRYGLVMPSSPTWRQLESLLGELEQASGGRSGVICLRGKAGWGENMALFSTMVNAFGGRWFDEQWEAAITEQPWQTAADFYLELMANHGLPAAWENGYSENLKAFRSGDCDIWVDSTAAGGAIASSDIYDHVGYARAPSEVTDQGANWLWSWGFAVPDASTVQDEAWRFVEWATSNDYHRLVEARFGIAQVPPGTRQSLYRNPAYQQYAHFADPTIDAIRATDFAQPSVQPVPYRGIQFVQTEEFQQIGNYVGKRLAKMLETRLNDQPVSIADEWQRASAFVRASMNVGNYLRERDIDAF